MPIVPPNDHHIALAVDVLKKGGCIGLPTETVYGLAADGLSASAVARIFELKQRPLFDPIILHIPQDYRLTEIADVNLLATSLAQKFWPGPLTLLLPKTKLVPDLVTSGLPTVAVRCPNHPIAQRVLQEFKKPLAAPSANRFGRISPTTAAAVQEELGDILILDGGDCPIGIESTIIDCSTATPRILRQGAVPLEDIRVVIGAVEIAPPSPTLAPGNLPAHYAPRKPLYCAQKPLAAIDNLPSKYAYLFWKEASKKTPVYCRCLTPEGSPREAAIHFFQYLRELDASPADAIIVEPVPNENLGAAIADRLQRASSGIAKWDNEKQQFLLMPKNA